MERLKGSEMVWLNSDYRIQNTMRELLDERSCVDVSIICKGGSLSAHRLVLASISPFLKSMLEDQLGPETAIILPSINIITVKKLMEFVYSGCLRASLFEIRDIFSLCNMLKLDLSGNGNTLMNAETLLGLPPETSEEGLTPNPADLLEQEEHYDPSEMDSDPLSELSSGSTQLPDSDSNHCQYCAKVFPESWQLKCHIKVHLGLKPFKCRFCPKHFSHPTNMRTHEKTFHHFQFMKSLMLQKRNKFQKDLSTRSIVPPSEVPNDMSDMQNKLYECTLCSKSFSEKWYLQYHMNIHTGDKPFKCKYCPKQFAQPSNMKKHEKMHSLTTPERELLMNPPSPEQNTRPKTPEQSLSTPASPTSPTSAHSCTICGKIFPTRWYLKYHLNIHTGEKPFHCKFCPKSFAQPANLKTHEKKHHESRNSARAKRNANGEAKKHLNFVLPDEKPVLQPIITSVTSLSTKTPSKSNFINTRRNTDNSSTNESDLSSNDMKLPTAFPPLEQSFNKSFPCQICGKSFSEKWYLQYHMNTHTGHKPFACSHCDRTFAQPSNLRTHIKTSHSDTLERASRGRRSFPLVKNNPINALDQSLPWPMANNLFWP